MRLLVRDPEWIFAYWDVSPSTWKDLARSLGERAFALSRLTLRVIDPVSGGSSDILLPPGARWWYVRTDSARRTYRAELGVILPSGEFRGLAESNTVVTPRVGPSPERARRRMSYGDARRPAARRWRRRPGPRSRRPAWPGSPGRRSRSTAAAAPRRVGTFGPRRGERRLPPRGRQRHVQAVGEPMPAGYWCPVLHAHLPYVRHPEYPSFLEEDWFFEALSETYVPIVRVLDGLLDDGVEYRLTMTLSPPLVSMMTDELLIGRYHRHLDSLVELARREVERTKRWQPHLHELAWFYLQEFSDVRRVFREVYGSNLLSAFRKHRDAGRLEIITCGATHGFFPLMDPVPQAVRAQVQVAAQHYRKHFGRDPEGIWLPECGYTPGHEVFLKEAGIRFSFLESHGLTDAHPRPSHGVHAPIVSPGGIVFFGRDMESSRQVWSSESGYPGDFDYREFYKDVGWELPMGDLEDFLPDGQRKNLGIKYYRVTGRGTDLGHKQPYVRAWAMGKAASHAGQLPLQPPAAGGAPRRRPRAARRSW